MNVRCRRLVMLFTLFAFVALGMPGAIARNGRQANRVYAVVDIDRIGFERLEALKTTPGIAWWEELDGQLLVCADRASLRSIAERHDVRTLDVPVDEAALRFVYRLHGDEALETGAVVLARGGNVSVVQIADDWISRLSRLHEGEDGDVRGPYESHAAVAPFVPNVALARQAANARPRPSTKTAGVNSFDVPVQTLVDSVDGNRWFADIQTLGGWNRWTRGSQVALARDWLVQQFQAMPGLTVETQSFSVGANTGFNVIATLTGTTRPDEWYIVGAHYDSTSQSPSTAAPGCEDNGSGTAGVLEMARIFTAHPPEATIKFICYSGEEQGLFGSTNHASGLVSSGDASKVHAMINMDMIGYTADADLDCLLETGAIGQFIIDACADAAADYTTLRIVTSLNPFGSDHVPYLNRGIPSLLTIENDYESYPGYHRTTDTANNITIEMGRQTLRMNVATIANFINGATAAHGNDTAGIYVPSTSTFFLKNANASGAADLAFGYGAAGAGWIPVTGDWNGDGVDTIGLYDPATAAFFLRNSNTPGAADILVIFGAPGATPVVGDWDGNGTDTIGIYVPSTATWFLKNQNTPGAADLAYGYGAAGSGWKPVVGDWNGDNAVTACAYDPSSGAWFETDAHAPGPASNLFVYGPPGMVPVRGDWDGH